MHKFLKSITHYLRLPSLCLICQQYHHELAICNNCFDYIEPLGYHCSVCALPLPDQSIMLCGQCIQKRPHFDRTYAAYTFEEPLRSLIHRFKYHNALHVSTFLSQLMLNAIDTRFFTPDCLIPIPMHPKRLRKRGFNQSVILTKILAKKLSVPFDIKLCNKVINTAPQAHLDGLNRKKNLINAFKVKPTKYNYVVLIDDLFTTGSTADELAKTLKRAGVDRVEIWCCARAVPKLAG